MPILHRLLHRTPALERIACVIMDTVLDIGSNFFIPLVVFLPYYFAFDMAIYSFPNEILYDLLQFTWLVTESRMVFTLSLLDLLSKSFNYLSIFQVRSHGHGAAGPTSLYDRTNGGQDHGQITIDSRSVIKAARARCANAGFSSLAA